MQRPGPSVHTVEHSYHQNRPSRVVEEDNKTFCEVEKSQNLNRRERTCQRQGSRMVVERIKELWFAFVTLAATGGEEGE